MSGHLTSQKIVRNVGLPLVNQFLAQGYTLVRILSALKIKPSTYYNWRHWQPSQQNDGPKVSEYITLKLMHKLENKSRMQKRW